MPDPVTAFQTAPRQSTSAPNRPDLAYRAAGLEGRSVMLHRLALVTTLAMFPLIWMGGLVTSKGAGMSVPDWPNTYGYNMFAVRWDLWIGDAAGGIFYEHFHRLLGTVVGFLALWGALAAFGVGRNRGVRAVMALLAGVLGLVGITSYVGLWAMESTGALAYDTAKHLSHLPVLMICVGLVAGVAWTCRAAEPRRWVRWLALGVLLAVIVQGVLGGLRVVWVSLDLAIVHGIFGQLTLCVAGLLCLMTTRWWVSADARPGTAPVGARGLGWGTVILAGLLVGQLGVAAVMRHYEAGLAIPDVPLHYGQVIPPTSPGELEAINDLRAFELGLYPVTAGQVWLHFAHRVGALVVMGWLAVLTWGLWRLGRGPGRWIAGGLWGLVLIQVTLGVLTVLWRKPADVATLHVATGAVLLLTGTLLAAGTLRRYGWAALAVGRPGRVAAGAAGPGPLRQSDERSNPGAPLPLH